MSHCSTGWFALAATSLACLPAGMAIGQATDPGVPDDYRGLIACRDVPDADRRLECFDKAATRLAGAVDRKEVVVIDREQVRKTRRGLFGFSLPRLALFGGGPGKENEPEVDNLETTVTSVRPYGFGFYVVGLAEGGVWQTIEQDRRTVPEKGMKVQIHQAALGSYVAKFAEGKAVRIKRIG